MEKCPCLCFQNNSPLVLILMGIGIYFSAKLFTDITEAKAMAYGLFFVLVLLILTYLEKEESENDFEFEYHPLNENAVKIDENGILDFD